VVKYTKERVCDEVTCLWMSDASCSLYQPMIQKFLTRVCVVCCVLCVVCCVLCVVCCVLCVVWWMMMSVDDDDDDN